MKHVTVVLVCIFLCAHNGYTQFFGELEWQKKNIPAVLTEVPQTASVTEDAIKIKFAQLGYSPRTEKGALLYKGIRLSEIGNETYDLVIKVDRKGRRDKEASIVYFALSLGNENYVGSNGDPTLTANMRTYCTRFLPWAEAQALEVEIQEQEEQLKSAEKKLENYKEESETLEKRRQKLEEDIKNNKENIEKQKREVDNQKKAVEVLKTRRKPVS
jgi:hypothetical protein